MNFQDLGATGIIVIVIAAFAVIGFLKGLIRTVLAMVCLGIAGYTALWGHEHASDLTGPWINNPGQWLPKIIALITGVVVFFICRHALKFVVDPFNQSSTGKRIGFGLPAAALSLCSGLAILWLAFTGIRYGGSIAELRHTQHKILKGTAAPVGTQPTDVTGAYATPLLLKAKHALDASSVGKWHQHTDPFYRPGKVALCQILILYHNSQTRSKMLKTPELNALLNRSDFLELAYESSIKEHATSGNPRALYSAGQIPKTLANPEFMEHLQQVSPEQLSKFISK
ncbi:MAG: CvpA family protein [Akkermansiaceae bacterium]|nr:CvpA family protein [Akkermansiaceae bacterium]